MFDGKSKRNSISFESKLKLYPKDNSSKNSFGVNTFSSNNNCTEVFNKEGEAVIQSIDPANPIMQLAAKQDYKVFYDGEIKLRAAFQNPPFVKLICLVISGETEQETFGYTKQIDLIVKNILQQNQELCTAYYEAMPAPIAKLKNRYRYRILLKLKNHEAVYALLQQVYDTHLQQKTKCMLDISIDPNSIL